MLLSFKEKWTQAWLSPTQFLTGKHWYGCLCFALIYACTSIGTQRYSDSVAKHGFHSLHERLISTRHDKFDLGVGTWSREISVFTLTSPDGFTAFESLYGEDLDCSDDYQPRYLDEPISGPSRTNLRPLDTGGSIEALLATLPGQDWDEHSSFQADSYDPAHDQNCSSQIDLSRWYSSAAERHPDGALDRTSAPESAFYLDLLFLRLDEVISDLRRYRMAINQDNAAESGSQTPSEVDLFFSALDRDISGLDNNRPLPSSDQTSPEQLAAEVKGTYAELGLAEVNNMKNSEREFVSIRTTTTLDWEQAVSTLGHELRSTFLHFSSASRNLAFPSASDQHTSEQHMSSPAYERYRTRLRQLYFATRALTSVVQETRTAPSPYASTVRARLSLVEEMSDQFLRLDDHNGYSTYSTATYKDQLARPPFMSTKANMSRYDFSTPWSETIEVWPMAAQDLDELPSTKTALERYRPVSEKQQASARLSCNFAHCHESFTLRKDLARHLRTKHSDQRPFRCTHRRCKYFERGFSRKDNLVRHLRSCKHGRTS